MRKWGKVKGGSKDISTKGKVSSEGTSSIGKVSCEGTSSTGKVSCEGISSKEKVSSEGTSSTGKVSCEGKRSQGNGSWFAVPYELKLGVRALVFRRKQYERLFLVCMVGVGFSLFALFLVSGMLSSLTAKAKIYYGGDYQFLSGDGMNHDNVAETVQSVQTAFPQGTVVSPRFDYNAENAALFFEGTAVRQRVIKGVDFAAERALFQKLTYVAGNADIAAGTDGVLLSAPIAQMLGVRAGDRVTLMLATVQGWTNTVQLTVRGIFRDSSLFGMYTSYVDLSFLRAAYGMPQTWANRMVVSLPEAPHKNDEARYRARLSAVFTLFPPVTDKQQFYDKLGTFATPTYALIPLSANLTEVGVLIDAMRAIVTFVTVMLVLIIVAGIGSTYRVIVMKRINEIGIYRALGMQMHGVYGIISAEVAALVGCGCAAGFVLSLMLCGIIRLFNFSFIPAFDIFLAGGRLVPQVSAVATVGLCALVCVTTLVAVLFSVRKSLNLTPVQALGVTE